MNTQPESSLPERLPMPSQDASAPGVANQENIRVSIVEDDAGARQILVDWIRLAPGFEFVSDYPNAEQSFEPLPKLKPSVVLMDINLPGLSGIECVRRLKPLLPDTQFVMDAPGGSGCFAVEAKSDLYTAVDLVIKKLQQQLRKRHNKGKAATRKEGARSKVKRQVTAVAEEEE